MAYWEYFGNRRLLFPSETFIRNIPSFCRKKISVCENCQKRCNGCWNISFILLANFQKCYVLSSSFLSSSWHNFCPCQVFCSDNILVRQRKDLVTQSPSLRGLAPFTSINWKSTYMGCMGKAPLKHQQMRSSVSYHTKGHFLQ